MSGRLSTPRRGNLLRRYLDFHLATALLVLWIVVSYALLNGLTIGLGLTGANTIRHGQATITACTRNWQHAWLGYTCTATISWEGGSTLTQYQDPDTTPATGVQTPRVLTGQVAVVERCACDGASGRHAIVPVDTPARSLGAWVPMAGWISYLGAYLTGLLLGARLRRAADRRWPPNAPPVPGRTRTTPAASRAPRAASTAGRLHPRRVVIASAVTALWCGLAILTTSGPQLRLGLTPGDTVLRRGQAQISTCHRVPAHLGLIYACPAEVHWTDLEHPNLDGRPSEPTDLRWHYPVLSTRPLSGAVAVQLRCDCQTVQQADQLAVATTIPRHQGWQAGAALLLVISALAVWIGTYRYTRRWIHA